MTVETSFSGGTGGLLVNLPDVGIKLSQGRAKGAREGFGVGQRRGPGGAQDAAKQLARAF